MSPKDDGSVTPDGVFFQSEGQTKIFAERHDKDVVQSDGGWLAKNRKTTSGLMPTREGDVVVRHLNQLFRVWVAPKDDAQEPDPNVAPSDVWSRDEAERAAREWVAKTNGRIFRLQKDGEWAILAN